MSWIVDAAQLVAWVMRLPKPLQKRLAVLSERLLWSIALTMGSMGEINRLTWEDVNLEEHYVVLYTRKKRGGHLTPRKIPMPEKLHQLPFFA